MIHSARYCGGYNNRMNSDVLEADLVDFLSASEVLWSGRKYKYIWKLILVGHSIVN